MQSRLVEKIIHQDEDLRVITTDDPNSNHPIRMCDQHQAELWAYQLNGTQFEQAVSVIFTLAARTLGTTHLIKHKCPICGLKNFDYISQTVAVVAPERQNGN